jgi:hypothetical protein
MNHRESLLSKFNESNDEVVNQVIAFLDARTRDFPLVRAVDVFSTVIARIVINLEEEAAIFKIDPAMFAADIANAVDKERSRNAI